MNNNTHFKIGSGYIKETPGAVYIAYVCDLDNGYTNCPVGLCLRIQKDGEAHKLKYDRFPMNIDWDKSREVSVAQAKATMALHIHNLSFYVGGMHSYSYKITKNIIHQLELFYQA
jgi:hypothetical protein